MKILSKCACVRCDDERCYFYVEMAVYSLGKMHFTVQTVSFSIKQNIVLNCARYVALILPYIQRKFDDEICYSHNDISF